MNFHGGNIYGFQNIVDYSSNINPVGVPDSFKHAIIKHIDEFSKYPEISYEGLKKNVGKYLKVNKENVAVGNGAVEIIYNFFRICSYKKVYIISPTFSEYKRAAELNGIEVEEIFAYNFDTMNFDIDVVLDSVQENSVVVLCNPNNPTGSFLGKEMIIKFINYLNTINSFLFVDETFIEFTGNKKNSLSDLKLDNLFVLRAATKFFGMPGLRLGYAVAESHIIKCIEKITPPWSINSAAVIASEVIFFDKEYIKKTDIWLNEIENMYCLLKEVEGLKVFKSHVNFHMIKILYNNIDCIQLYEGLVSKGFAIRISEGFKGLDKSFFRVAVKDDINNKKFVFTLKEVLKCLKG